MDPNQTLHELRVVTNSLALAEEYTREELLELASQAGDLFHALDTWLINGGFRPTAWNDALVRYAAGWNQPGYLPNPDVVVSFETVEEAADYLIDEVERAWDADFQSAWIDGGGHVDDSAQEARWSPVLSELWLLRDTARERHLPNLDYPYEVYTSDRSEVFWVTRL